jgi:hypothetical protein
MGAKCPSLCKMWMWLTANCVQESCESCWCCCSLPCTASSLAPLHHPSLNLFLFLFLFLFLYISLSIGDAIFFRKGKLQRKSGILFDFDNIFQSCSFGGVCRNCLLGSPAKTKATNLETSPGRSNPKTKVYMCNCCFVWNFDSRTQIFFF